MIPWAEESKGIQQLLMHLTLLNLRGTLYVVGLRFVLGIGMWLVGMLRFWDKKMLGCWNVGMLGNWDVVMLRCCRVGILGCWVAEMMRCCIAGILGC